MVTYLTSSAEVVVACVAALVDAIGEEVEAVICWVGIVTGIVIAVNGAAVNGAVVVGDS